jgi:SAM-dependent methyltransferase
VISEITGLEPRRHRKAWEFALGVQSLERAGVLDEEAMGLSVGAGHEAIVYYLANRCRWIFATDVYGSGSFSHVEGSSLMLVDPDLYAPYEYRRNRLTACYMDALDLRFEDETFDYVVSFGSIEHFGGIEQATASLKEAARVVRPGGLVFVTTELAVDGGTHASIPGIELFSPSTLTALVDAIPDLTPLDGLDLSIPDNSSAPLIDLGPELGRIQAGNQTLPHVRMGVRDRTGLREFTSVAIALGKDAR